MELTEKDTSRHEEEQYIYKKKKKTSKCKENKKSIRIKPVFLKDLRILKTSKTRDGNKNKKRIKKLREDICPYCGKKTRSITSHVLKHTAEKKYFCNECNRSFYTKSSLKVHIKSHLNKFIFKCDHCIDSFSNKTALTKHMISHTDVKDFICKICEKAFKRKYGLHRHMLSHSISKQFKCEQCTMSFITKYNLQHHSRVHTGVRPYKCEICSQPYSYKRDFNRHCLKKHGIFIDHRSVYIMNEEVLQQEKALMKDIILKMHGMKTAKDPLVYFQGPRGAVAFAKAVKLLESKKIVIDVHL